MPHKFKFTWRHVAVVALALAFLYALAAASEWDEPLASPTIQPTTAAGTTTTSLAECPNLLAEVAVRDFAVVHPPLDGPPAG